MKPESHRAKLTWRHLFKVLQGAINQTLNFCAECSLFLYFIQLEKGEFRERTTQPMYFPSLHCKNVHRHDKKKCTTQVWNFSYSSTFSSLARENDHKYGRESTNAVKFHQVTRGFGFLFSSFTSTKHTAAAFQILSHNSQNTWRNIHFGLCVNVFMV